MNLDEFMQYVDELDVDMLYPTGFEDCIMGLVVQADGRHALLMDTDKIILKLIDDGLDPDDAWEHFEFNIMGSRFMEGPVYLIERITND